MCLFVFCILQPKQHTSIDFQVAAVKKTINNRIIEITSVSFLVSPLLLEGRALIKASFRCVLK